MVLYYAGYWMPGFTELVMLLFDWFMLAVIMLLSIRSIMNISPFVKKTLVGQTVWYLLIAFGYSLICVTIFTSWVIWFIGGFWALIILFLTWFILVYIFFTYKKISEAIASDLLKPKTSFKA